MKVSHIQLWLLVVLSTGPIITDKQQKNKLTQGIDSACFFLIPETVKANKSHAIRLSQENISWIYKCIKNLWKVLFLCIWIIILLFRFKGSNFYNNFLIKVLQLIFQPFVISFRVSIHHALNLRNISRQNVILTQWTNEIC